MKTSPKQMEMKKEEQLEQDQMVFEEHIALTILECLKTLKAPLGRNKLAGVLVGSLAAYVFDNGFNTSPHFGILNFFNRQQVIEMIDQLIIEGCISFGGDEYPVLVLTGLGKAVLEGAKKIRIQLPYKLNGKPIPPPSDPELFIKLRHWRRDQAQKEELPAFCIIQNKTLFELTERKPNDLKELYDVYGLSNIKVEKYGNMILEVIHADVA